MFTCLMHPQIRLPTAGVCPICGMALEPDLATGEPTAIPELADLSHRFWIGLALTAPAFVRAMGGGGDYRAGVGTNSGAAGGGTDFGHHPRAAEPRAEVGAACS